MWYYRVVQLHSVDYHIVDKASMIYSVVSLCFLPEIHHILLDINCGNLPKSTPYIWNVRIGVVFDPLPLFSGSNAHTHYHIGHPCKLDCCWVHWNHVFMLLTSHALLWRGSKPLPLRWWSKVTLCSWWQAADRTVEFSGKNWSRHHIITLECWHLLA